ncbi:MAG: molybdopterin molybdotransferase MoeA [Shimia sp.]
MISVAEALERLFALVEPLGPEDVPLRDAHGRVLAQPVTARRTQPPFAASAMDGYALRTADAHEGATLDIIGEAAAGHGFAGSVGPGQAVRIFTGAPLPDGADHITIQEDVARAGDRITLTDPGAPGAHIRPAGADFTAGHPFDAPWRLSPSDIALLGAMGHGTLPVTRRPSVALIATGDELVQPGEAPGPDQIVASNSYGLAAMVEREGAIARLLPIARDNPESLISAFRFARGADLIVTIGGASVGDHDIVGRVAADLGLDRSFYKIAMRPGKPLMAGRLRGVPLVGLPGNPVSAMVCGEVFLIPLLRAMLGLGKMPRKLTTLPLTRALGANGPRAHYMRARRTDRGVEVADRQDSALLSILSGADALVLRPPHDPPRAEGDLMDVLPLTGG